MANQIQYLLLKPGKLFLIKSVGIYLLLPLMWSRREVRKKGGKVLLKSREWVMAKKERRRRQGKGYGMFVYVPIVHN